MLNCVYNGKKLTAKTIASHGVYRKLKLQMIEHE